jgi:hypothetical protein
MKSMIAFALRIRINAFRFGNQGVNGLDSDLRCCDVTER